MRFAAVFLLAAGFFFVVVVFRFALVDRETGTTVLRDEHFATANTEMTHANQQLTRTLLGVDTGDTLKTTHYAAPSKRSKGVMVKDAAELVAALKAKGLL